MNSLTHQLWDFSRVFGLRDRLRCPQCRAVGTWKPHGGWLDTQDERKVRRWMCKWCGHYLGPEGVKTVVMGPTAWAMPEDVPNGQTPMRIVMQATGRNVGPYIGPWFG